MPYEKELVHKDLKIAVEKRDRVFLFCWDRIQCNAAHIVAQEDVPFPCDEPTLFERTGLKQKHQVQNGLLLCAVCHGEFNALKRYVDVIDEKLVVKVVNYANDSTSDKHRDWNDNVRLLKGIRMLWQENCIDIDNRQTNDTTSDKHQKWLDAKEVIKFVREGQSRLKSNLTCKDGRKAV